LRAAAGPRPPRLPGPGEDQQFDEFGTAAEDGLRMLAALETMPSLEPDFGEDLTAEAAVTIVEHTGAGGRGARDTDANSLAKHVPRRSLAARLGDMPGQFDAEADYDAALLGPIEEATVEIIEVRENDFVMLPPGSAPSRRKGRKPGRV
jgi:hypothetical protein